MGYLEFLPRDLRRLGETLDAYFALFPGEEKPPHEWLMQEPARAFRLYERALREGRHVTIDPDESTGLDQYKAKLGKKIA